MVLVLHLETRDASLRKQSEVLRVKKARQEDRC